MISRKFFTPRQRIGIYVDSHGLSAVQCEAERPEHARWREFQPLEDVTDSHTLDSFFSRLHRQVGHRYIPMGIALADPWVHQVMLGFDTLPRKTRDRETLIQWRLARDWQRNAEQYAISWQLLGEQHGQQWIVAQSIERQRLDPLLQQARAYGLMLSGIDAIGNLLLNRLPQPHNTLLLHLQPDYWSLLVTDGQGWPVYRRSTWQAWPEAAQYETFAAQLERMVVTTRPERLERVTVATTTEPAPALYEALAKRLGIKPAILTLSGSSQANRSPEETLATQTVSIPCH